MTTRNVNFNEAIELTIGSQELTIGGNSLAIQTTKSLTEFGWTSLPSGPYEPGFKVTDNELVYHYDGTYRNIICRYDSNLASDDHYAQLTLKSQTHNTAFYALATRLSSSAMTGYVGGFRQNSGTMRLWKVVAGTYTQIGSHTLPSFPGFPLDLKLESNGSTHKIYVNDEEKLSVEDSSITGNVRCGVADGYNLTSVGHGWTGDSFVAADLGSGGSTGSGGMSYVNCIKLKGQ